jgi:glycerol kinase
VKGSQSLTFNLQSLFMFLGIDQGTSGTTVIAFDEALKPLAQAYRAIQSYHPRAGWVEQNPHDIIQSIAEAVAEVLAKLGNTKIEAVGLTNQGESVLGWDAKTGEALSPIIVWSDRRAAALANELANLHGERVRELTGLELSDYFCASKYAWLLQHNADVQKAARENRLHFGTLDSWMAFKLGGLQHVSDASTASRTQLLGLQSARWESELLDIFGVPLETLPEVRPSLSNWGILRHTSWQQELPWFASLVDQSAALAGNGCLKTGDIKITYGTGCFVYIHAGSHPPKPGKSLLASVAWNSEKERTFALDGGVFTAATAINWLVSLGLAESPEQTAALAQSSTNYEIKFLPAFTGLGAPWWDSEARGVFSGLSAGTTKADLTRAVLDSIAYRVTDVVKAMWQARNPKPDVIKVDGGLTKNPYLMGLQANLLGVRIAMSEQKEATALGAALLAGHAAGLLDMNKVPFEQGTVYEPQWSEDKRETAYGDWLRWLEKARTL